jgi:hypothetical protein
MVTKKAKKKSAASGKGGKKATKKGAAQKAGAQQKSAAKKGAAKKAAKKASKKGASKGGVGLAAGTLLLVNMVPRALSGEENQDSEPHLTVCPDNPNQIVGTAFTPDPGGGANAPIYISMDGGNKWTLNSIVPSAPGPNSGTSDITVGFNRDASRLYAGILRLPTIAQELLRTRNFVVPTPMDILNSRSGPDQPFTHIATVGSKDRMYVGNNDLGPGLGGRTATIDQSLDARKTSPAFSKVRLEVRVTSGQDGPQVRPVAHTDGTVYAVFYRWRSTTGNFKANTLVVTSADVIVVRDDSGGAGATPYKALLDPDDDQAGVRVVKGVSFPFMFQGRADTGQQRIGGSLSIAVDPRDSSTVYLAWADRPAGGSIQTLHVTRSQDRGKTWPAELLTLRNSINGSLAVNSDGKVAFLYQEFRNKPGDPRWVTHVRRSIDGVNWDDLILADTPATDPPKSFDPYLGDYAHLTSVGKNFYGIFSASNIPDLANFPSGVTYQRNADFAGRRLLRLDNMTVVRHSIDPFFFKLTE